MAHLKREYYEHNEEVVMSAVTELGEECHIELVAERLRLKIRDEEASFQGLSNQQKLCSYSESHRLVQFIREMIERSNKMQFVIGRTCISLRERPN
jgi:hypothetical protein